MKRIFESASKIVFIVLALSLVGLTFDGKVSSDDFVKLTAMAFVYYFTKKSDTPVS